MRYVGIVSLFLIVSAGAWAEDLPSGPAAGQILFHTYCASCHGIRADGNGPVAAELRTPPADLTRLADRHGLPLPKDAIAAMIDGRRDVVAHGPREMPVWGDEFFPGETADNPDRDGARRRTIRAIVEYLESIQQQQESRAPGRRGG
jgi:mono/diheme cytochrome c family protein